MANRYRGRNKRMAFNSLLRGDNPIFARFRSEKRILSRHGDFTSMPLPYHDDSNDPLMESNSTLENPAKINFYSKNGLDIMISIEKRSSGEIVDHHSNKESSCLLKEGSSSSGDLIYLSAVLDVVQDENLPATKKSLNFMPFTEIYGLYKSMHGFFDLLSEGEDGFKNNCIDLPYYVDPEIDPQSSNLNSLSSLIYVPSNCSSMVDKKNEFTKNKISNFTTQRFDIELEKIIKNGDIFNEDIATIGEEANLVNELAYPETINPIFECEWSHLKLNSSSIPMKEATPYISAINNTPIQLSRSISNSTLMMNEEKFDSEQSEKLLLVEETDDRNNSMTEWTEFK